MFAGKTVSYKAILDKVIRDFGFNYDVHEEEGVEWLAEFMAHTNVPMTLENNIAYIKICDGRAELPFDLHKIGQVSHLTSVNNIEEAECGKGRMFPMRWATDYFHKRYHIDRRDLEKTMRGGLTRQLTISDTLIPSNPQQWISKNLLINNMVRIKLLWMLQWLFQVL